MASNKKEVIDWASCAVDYRAGILPLRTIAGRYGITEGAIRKRAKTEGWKRDLKDEVKREAKAILISERESTQAGTQPSTQNPIVRTIVSDNANAIAELLREHGHFTGRTRAVLSSQLEELEEVTIQRELFEQLGEFMRAPDDKGLDKLNDLYRKVMSLPNRIKCTKDIADTLRVIVGLDRERYGITDRTPGSNEEDALTRIIKAVQGSALKPVAFIDGESERVE